MNKNSNIIKLIEEKAIEKALEWHNQVYDTSRAVELIGRYDEYIGNFVTEFYENFMVMLEKKTSFEDRIVLVDYIMGSDSGIDLKLKDKVENIRLSALKDIERFFSDASDIEMHTDNNLLSQVKNKVILSHLMQTHCKNSDHSIIGYIFKSTPIEDTQDVEGNTLMHIFAKLQCDNLINALAKSGAKLDLRNKAQVTPLEVAFDNENLKTAKCLIKLGADLLSTDNNRNNIFHKIAKYPENQKVMMSVLVMKQSLREKYAEESKGNKENQGNQEGEFEKKFAKLYYELLYMRNKKSLSPKFQRNLQRDLEIALNIQKEKSI